MNQETKSKISQAIPNLLKQYYFRSSHLKGSVKKGVLRKFWKFTGKHLCQKVYFNTVGAHRPATLLKKSLWHRCFPVNFAKFLTASFLRNTSGRLLLLFPHKSAYFSNNSHNAYKNVILANKYEVNAKNFIILIPFYGN